MLDNPLKDPVEKKNWVGVVVMGAFLVCMAVWGVFRDQLKFDRSSDKENRAEIAQLHKYYQRKIDSLNLRNENNINAANKRIDRANARTDSVIAVQVKEKSELIALFTSKLGPVQTSVEVSRRKTRTLEQKVDNANNLVQEIKADAKKIEKQ